MEEIISQGAEALLIKQDDKLVKRRIKKSYRLPALDESLRKRRTRGEAKLLEKASKVIPVPKIIKVSEQDREIVMDFIPGKILSTSLDDFSLEESCKICRKIGNQSALLHNAGIIHGDLTTSNMIFHDGKLFFIDFGLGFHSPKIEDKAVDLHLLKQALESKHFRHYQDYFNAVLEGYKESSSQALQILNQLDKVEGRGRYKGKKKENY